MALLDSGELYRKYEEKLGVGLRLGRHLWLDGRSLAYMVENNVAEMMFQHLDSKMWERKIPILDQGSLGSCTGNAGVGALGTEPFFTSVASYLPDSVDALEQAAVDLYAGATRLDGYAGVYPPDDTGSSGLAVCKMLKKRNWIKSYRWARTPYGFARLLQAGPVLMGMPWYNSFFTPNRDGFIDGEGSWEWSGLAGGHEIEVLGITLDPHDFFSSVLTIANSWGESWGDSGYFRMRMRTYEALSGVDLKQFVMV